jgi:hypothetical protein
MGVGSQHHAPAALPLGKTQYPLYMRLDGTWGRSGEVWKISPPQRFNPRTVQPVASCYTDWAIPAHEKRRYKCKIWSSHSIVAEYFQFLGCDAVLLGHWCLVCWRTTRPSATQSKRQYICFDHKVTWNIHVVQLSMKPRDIINLYPANVENSVSS